MTAAIGVGVVAHPRRTTMAHKLASATGAATVMTDYEGIGCAQNHVRVLRRLLRGEPTWLVVLEDDAKVVPEFGVQVREALHQARTLLVSLYLGTGHNPAVQSVIRGGIAKADANEAAWLHTDCLMAGVGYAVHTTIGERLLDYLDDPTDPDELPLRITRWAQANRLPVSYTWPSLVDHPDGFSTIAQCDLAGRVAHRWGGRANWDAGWVDMGSIPGWSC